MSLLSPHIPENFLPFGVDRHAFIAGGYAACPERASDIDVWVTDQTGRLEMTRANLLAHLKASGFAAKEEIAQEGFRVDGFGYDELDVRILKVAYVQQGAGRLPIHLMVTDAKPFPVLMHFDVSTHQIALVPIGGTLDIMRGPEWTDITEEPVQIRETSATNARMEKIRTRYADMRTNGKSTRR